MYTVHLDNLGMISEFQFPEEKQKAVWSVVIEF